MRQAGRYLPEYLEVRAQAGSFLNLCYSPDLAAEVTLQPIRRFHFDAAILFSDILVVPDALGQDVQFSEGKGPQLVPINSNKVFSRLDRNRTHEKFSKVFETVRRIKSNLPETVSLIGFCGSPWTVATYMVGGRGSTDQAKARLLAYKDPDFFSQLIDLLVAVSIDYLSGQIAAGAEVIQLFDSWSGNLPDDQFARWVVEPTKRIVAELKNQHKTIPIIGFPRGCGPLYADYVEKTAVDGVSCDTTLPLKYISKELQPRVTTQGNLDPLLLLTGGNELDKRVDQIKSQLAGGPFIFNLGHGILPSTPVENVSRLIEKVRS